jgi:mono/diheme cytochrome c family protein
MSKRLFSLIFVAAICATLVSAQDSKLTIPVKSTAADDGKQMYANYCAPCHGLDGRGQGPTAAALKTPPVDLTVLSKNNKGQFPGNHVVAVLKFGVENSAHGSKDMPIWGPALGKMDHGSSMSPDTQSLRIANLVKYVETLQVK